MKKLLIISIFIGVLIFATWFVFTEYLYVVPILVYHHVDDEIYKDSPTVLRENFAQQMQFIHEKDYNVIALDELVDSIQGNYKLPRNSVVITFDDGYQDNYVHAFPILNKFNFPAIIFIATNKIDTKGFLTWDQIFVMQKNNISFGSHTRAHAYLPELEEKELKHLF